MDDNPLARKVFSFVLCALIGGYAGYFIEGCQERRFIGLGRLCEAAYFAYELERSGSDFFVGDRRIEIEKRLDVSAHTVAPRVSLSVSFAVQTGKRVAGDDK